MKAEEKDIEYIEKEHKDFCEKATCLFQKYPHEHNENGTISFNEKGARCQK